MGFKAKSDVPPMERELIFLLYDLCVKWGFCIPADDHDKISKKEHYTAIGFAQDVTKAEGLDEYSGWVNRIAERFKERFGTGSIDSSTFVDRIRGNKENW